jgi:Uma2 family endonuclease
MSQALPGFSLVDQQHIVLDFISWDFYERLLEEIGNRPIRVTYDSGSLEIMAPLHIHEHWKTRFGFLIESLCTEREIDFIPGGSVTLRLQRKDKGLEPDECYYIQNAAAVEFKDDSSDLTKYPAPDLAIEIDITSRSIQREPIYAALGIPELWRFDGKNLTVLLLGGGSQYTVSQASLAFPFLPMAEFSRFLKRFETEKNVSVIRAFREWVKQLP